MFVSSRWCSIEFFLSLNWAEDAALNIIDKLQKGEKIADYFLPRYAVGEKTITGDNRRTLQYRLRYMLEKFLDKKSSITDFQQWRFSGLEGALDILVFALDKFGGEDFSLPLKTWTRDLQDIWHVVSQDTTPEELDRAVHRLLNTLEDVFAIMHKKINALENASEEPPKLEDKIERLAEKVDESAKVQRQQNKLIVGTLAAAKIEEAEENEYSRYAGLDKFRPVRRLQLKKAIDYSHDNDFRVTKDARGNNHGNTLSKLAAVVWLENKDEFERLAKIEGESGYKNAESLGTALYNLAKKYPSADHFVWE